MSYLSPNSGIIFFLSLCDLQNDVSKYPRKHHCMLDLSIEVITFYLKTGQVLQKVNLEQKIFSFHYLNTSCLY